MRGDIGLMDELKIFGERTIKGKFSAGFDLKASPGGAVEEGRREDQKAETVRVKVENPCARRRDTEFALKMALTYQGQDPAQVHSIIVSAKFRGSFYSVDGKLPVGKPYHPFLFVYL